MSANSALRALAPCVIVIANIILAVFGMWAILRQCGITTFAPEVPTQWEIGRAPYILGLLAAVLVYAILTAAGFRLARSVLMLMITLCTLCLLLWALVFEVLLRRDGIQWTAKTAIGDLEYLVAVDGWCFICFWGLLSTRGEKARRL